MSRFTPPDDNATRLSWSRLWFGFVVLLAYAASGCGTTLPGDWPLGQCDNTAGVGLPTAGRSVPVAASGAAAVSGSAGAAAAPGPAPQAGRGSKTPTAGKGGTRADQDGDGWSASTDCNDFNAAIHPGAPENCCDGIDSNCDGRDAPQGDSCDCARPLTDLDGDGYPSNVMGPKWDCDDQDASIHPFAAELCKDGRDNDCNGVIDWQDKACVSTANAPDQDGDGYTTLIDCNDADPAVHPGATERCGDSLDDNCDGIAEPCTAPADQDHDRDGFPEVKDCNDWDAQIFPGSADETCCDAIDSNCDGRDDPPGVMCNCFDADGDGYVVGPIMGSLADCNDQDSSIHPGAPEICDDKLDNDCDRRVDTADSECRTPL